MSKFCTSCGKKIADGAMFCNFCGSRQPAPKAPAAEPERKKTGSAKKSVPAEMSGKAAPKAENRKKKKGGCGLGTIAVLLVAVLLFTGFILPGFIWDIIYPDEPDPSYSVPYVPSDTAGESSVPKDSRNLSDEAMFLPDSMGNSRALSYSPCEGVYVTAPEDAFEEDTVITVTPLTEADDTAMGAFGRIEDEGALPVAAFEVNAGLSDDEIMPGTYTVSIDLDSLEIGESLYDYLTAYRIADDGTYYEYNARVENGKLIYESDQNSIVGIAVRIVGGIVINQGFKYFKGQTLDEIAQEKYDEEFNGPFLYFTESGKKQSHFEGSCRYARFRITWNTGDLGTDEKAVTKKLEKLKKSYEDDADRLVKEYEESRLFEATGILGIFAKNKTKAEIIAEAIENDPEYRKLQKELKVPDAVAYCAECAGKSFEYLKEHEYVKMPTGVIEIASKPGLDVLGQAVNRVVHEAYVQVNLAKVNPGTQEVREDFLITMTHELLHVCQQNYRAAWADSPRFDEMVAVYMEKRAFSQYQYQGDISYDSTVTLSSSDYWSEMKLPIDKYYVEEDANKKGQTMRHQGYNLALFLDFLNEKTGKTVWAGKLMEAKKYFKEGGTSKPLMSVYGISEAEFDIYYRTFMRRYKGDIAQSYEKHDEAYERNSPVLMTKGGKYHVRIDPEGSYTGEIMCFYHKSDSPAMKVLLIPDERLGEEQPDCNLVTIEKAEDIARGYILSPSGAKSNIYEILEIHGTVGSSGTEKTTGFTVYATQMTNPPTVSEDNSNLIVKLPVQSLAADDGAVDGYILKVSVDGKTVVEKTIPRSDFGKDDRTKKEAIYSGYDRTKELAVSVTLCEYVRKNETEIVPLEESIPVKFTLTPETEPADMSDFTAVWVPLEYKGSFKSSDWVIGLTYNEQYDEFFEYEGPASTFYSAPGRWVEIKYYDFDSKTGTLSIDFGKNKANGDGVATFRIKANGNLEMTNYGGTYEFYRAGADEGF